MRNQISTLVMRARNPNCFVSELNDLMWDIGPAKKSVEPLGSRLKLKSLLSHGTSFSWFCHCEKAFASYVVQENNLMYRTHPKGLLEKFGKIYNNEDWCTFIDSSLKNP